MPDHKSDHTAEREEQHSDNFAEYRRLILSELRRLDAVMSKMFDKVDGMTKDHDTFREDLRKVLDDKLDEMQEESEGRIKVVENDILAIKTRSMVWGAVAGGVAVIAGLVIQALTGGLLK